MTSDTREAGNNANNIETFSVNNLADNKSFPGSFLRKAKTVSASQINGCFGCDGLVLNIHDMSRHSSDYLLECSQLGHETQVS